MTIRHPSAICQCHWVKWFLWPNSYITSQPLQIQNTNLQWKQNATFITKPISNPRGVCRHTNVSPFSHSSEHLRQSLVLHMSIAYQTQWLDLLFWFEYVKIGYNKHLNFYISTWYVKAATAKRVFLPNILCNIGQHN